MSNSRLIYISTGLYDSSEENDGDIDDIPLKKTKFESLIAAESDEEDPTPGRKIAVTNLVVSVASEVEYDFNNLTNDKSETELDEDEEKIFKTSEEHKVYETEFSITEIATNEELSEKHILQKKTRSESFACVATDRDDNVTLKVSLRSRDIEQLNNFAGVKNETVTRDDDNKISETSEENKIRFINNKTQLFSRANIETNGNLDAERTEIIFAQNDFQECCESDTTDITVMFGRKEINIAEPNKVNDENVKDAENEFKASSFDKECEKSEKSKNPANVKNNENTKDSNNGENDDVVVEVSKNPENVNDNDDIKKFGNGDNQVAVETHEQYLYRMLRPGEDHENGITAKDINSTTSINDHVAYGSSSSQKSKYISCTKSKEKVFTFASLIRKRERSQKRMIIKIDKSKLGCNVDIVDLTDTSNQVMHLGDRAKKNALRFDEVLLVPEVHIPPESITAIAHIQNGSITHYS